MQLPIQFLSKVLPAQGWRIFNAIMPEQAGQRFSVPFEFHMLDTAQQEKISNWAISKQADMYMAVAGYGNEMRTVKQGRNVGQQRAARTATNAIWHRSLRIDIDVYDGLDPVKMSKTPYRTKGQAWQTLKHFIKTACMPMPTIIDSGYGLHVYWSFGEDIDLNRWLALSARLASAVAHHGLVVDTTCTEDAARVLRLPGSFNFKNGGAVEVKTLAFGDDQPASFFEGQLQGYRPVMSVPTIGGSLPRTMAHTVSPLAANLHPPYFLRNTVVGCPGLTNMFATHGEHAHEPLWHAALAVVHKAADTDDKKELLARALSSGHAGFTEQSFQHKWAQVQAQNYEPPTCEKFAQIGMPQCQGCPLRATVRSPVVLGRVQAQTAPVAAVALVATPTAPAALPIMPQTVATGPSVQQGIFVMTPGVAAVGISDGQLSRSLCVSRGIPCVIKVEPNPTAGMPPIQTMIPIGKYAIVQAERLLDTEGKTSLTAITFSRMSDGMRRIEFSHRELAEPRSFATLLHSNGVHMSANDVKTMQDRFMPEFLAQLQSIKQANAIASRCGWNEDMSKFVLGTTIYSAAGAEHIRPSGSQSEMESYHALGDESRWRAAFDLILAGGVDRQALVALGIAGPLMAFSGVNGVLVNAYSADSGVGKSTLCDAILSIWGSPDRLRKDYRDTAAATFHLAAISGNLPMVIDEFTNVDGKDLSNYIYTITQGRERHRLTSESKLRDNPNRWCLPMIATSNLSVHTKLQAYRIDAVAEAARVFEMRLHPLPLSPQQMGAAKSTIEGMKTNYGFLGPRLVQLFMSRPESYWRKMVTDRIAVWDVRLASDTGDRFRSVAAALMDLGATIGHALGFNFDRLGIVKSITEHWKKQVDEFDQSRMHPKDFVTSYIADHLPKLVLFTGPNGDQMTGNMSNEYVGEIRGVSKNSTQMTVQSVIIPSNNLREYVQSKNGNYRAVQEWVERERGSGGLVMQMGQVTFMAGTPRSIRLQGVRFSGAIMGQAVLAIPQPVAGVVNGSVQAVGFTAPRVLTP